MFALSQVNVDVKTGENQRGDGSYQPSQFTTYKK